MRETIKEKWESFAIKHHHSALCLCKVYSERGLCIKRQCETCKLFVDKSIYKSQGELVEEIIYNAKVPSLFLSSIKKQYDENAKIKQGEIEKIYFSKWKNISDLFPEAEKKLIKNEGFEQIHFSNWMNEDICIYISQGDGIKTETLEAISGKFITLDNGNDIELLIGNPKLEYRMDRYFDRDVLCVDVFGVKEE